jgi:hypothetical protein
MKRIYFTTKFTIHNIVPPSFFTIEETSSRKLIYPGHDIYSSEVLGTIADSDVEDFQKWINQYRVDECFPRVMEFAVFNIE